MKNGSQASIRRPLLSHQNLGFRFPCGNRTFTARSSRGPIIRALSCSHASTTATRASCSWRLFSDIWSESGADASKEDFIRSAEENFTPYYQPLIPWINRLRKVVFPNGERWEREDTGLYARMREITGEAREDPKVLADK